MLTAGALEGVRRCGFVGFDDDLLVYHNPHVQGGLTWAGARWALGADLLFDSPNADYWTPLTALSRLVDVQLFGLDPAGHHLTNLFFHAVAVVLLFLVFESMTGDLWRSAFVAALMAIHPLHVESVAWVSERKDVLSAVFFMLSLAAYSRYARDPRPVRFAAVAVAQALGLLAKPMLATLPFVLLLLDLWPLGRLRLGESGGGARAGRLAVEKWPLFCLSFLSLAATFVPLARTGTLTSLDALPLQARLGNALCAYVVYVRQTLWPHPLAIPYPHPGRPLPLEALGAALALACVTGATLRAARLRPWLLVGWLWFLGMLVPVIGLVQSGEHAHADRYMYLPSIGLSVMLAWGVPDLLSVWGAGRVAPLLGALAVAACVPITRAQVGHWQSTVTLFAHAIRVTPMNFVAHSNLATGLARQGDFAAAERHYREAIRIRPVYWEARTGLGVVLMRQGRLAEALEQQREALRSNPASADVSFNLGALEARMGQSGDAANHYAQAVRLNPGLGAAHYNWGNLLVAAGRLAEAEDRFAEAVRLQPQDVEALNNLGLTIGLQGRWPQAAEVLGRAVALDPGHTRARVNLGRALRELGRLDEARAQWREAARRNPRDPASAEALEELGRLKPDARPP